MWVSQARSGRPHPTTTTSSEVAGWLLDGTTIISGGNIGAPGNTWQVQNHNYDYL